MLAAAKCPLLLSCLLAASRQRRASVAAVHCSALLLLIAQQALHTPNNPEPKPTANPAAYCTTETCAAGAAPGNLAVLAHMPNMPPMKLDAKAMGRTLGCGEAGYVVKLGAMSAPLKRMNAPLLPLHHTWKHINLTRCTQQPL